jgi:CubicO group peptidase (beta-lactamase class C family)
VGSSDDLIAELTEVVGEIIATHHAPGMVAGVWVDGEAHVVAHGVTSVEHPAPVVAATQFQVGSVTKTFTSAAVALLVEEGVVGWDDPVARHLPELAAAVSPTIDLEAITVEHLLSHRSGFDGDHFLCNPDLPDLASLHGARHLFAPGEGYSYSNAAFSVAGALVEAICGEPYGDVVRRRLTDPLGLVGACFTADEAITYPVAVGHWVVDGQAHLLRRGGWQPGWELSAIDRPVGGLVASVPHLLRWGRFQLDGLADDGRSVLAPETLDRLHTPVVSATEVEDVALDWEVTVHDGVTVYGHGGLTVGYATTLGVVPDSDVVVACCTHATNGGIVNRDVRRWILERTCGIEVRDPVPDPSAAADDAVERVAGRYVHAFGVLTVAAADDPGTVRITTEARTDVGWQPPPDPPVTFGFTGPCDAVSTDSPVARLLRCGEGWIQLDGRRAPRIDD